jgi:hypothetical protein
MHTKNMHRRFIKTQTILLVVMVTLLNSSAYFAFPEAAGATIYKVIFLTAGTSWNVPSDWDSSTNTIEVIGGGGGGGQNTNSGGGGGGGGYSKITNLSLTPGGTVGYAIGSGGAGGTTGTDSGDAGGDTYFCNTTSNCASIGGTAVQVGAKGGGGGALGNPASGGSGGSSASGVGGVKFSGGNGGGASNSNGGGGGGAGGPHGNGAIGGAPSGSGGNGSGGGGGADGGSAGASNSGSTGGDGGDNRNGTGGGQGGSSGNPGGAGTDGGGGGGGGSGASGGDGSYETIWTSTSGGSTAGPGSGGGGTKDQGANPTGGTGGGYGGGGGGSGNSGGAAGNGTQGIIVITYAIQPATTFTGNVQFSGNLSVTDSISKGSGSFVIDHPLDPKNKLLYHSFVESPDVKNVYDGVAELNENGEATITLPDYFEALNKEFRYLGTPLVDAMPNLHIKKEIKDNKFTIAGGKPYGRIFWQVTGIRHDPYILANPIIPEVEKGPAALVMKGEYLFDGYKKDALLSKIKAMLTKLISVL